MEPRITYRPDVGTSATILQQQELEFKRLHIDHPVLIVVERGVKSLRCKNGEYIIRPGEAIAIAGGQSIDITNRLSEDGTYRAHWLMFDRTLIVEHEQRHGEQPVICHALPICQVDAGFVGAFQRSLQAVTDESIPIDIARHRVGEMLIWIGLHGGQFDTNETLTFAIKVRRLIGRDLAGDWRAAHVASSFAMSEATLRRKLAEENMTLSEILSDARLSFALNLLQSTVQPVTQIALNVGYQSPSNFAVRFRQRFGFSPSAIRGQRRGVPDGGDGTLVRIRN
jgi:AraC-like DNA-binding protein